jgi:DNA replication protein DnaC
VNTDHTDPLSAYYEWTGLVVTPKDRGSLDPDVVRQLETAAAKHATCAARRCPESCDGMLLGVRRRLDRPGLVFRPTPCDRRAAVEHAEQLEREATAPAAAEAAVLAQRLERLPPLLRTKTLVNFSVTRATRLAHDAAVACATDATRWLVLAGPPGTGKTHLSAGVVVARIEAGIDGRLIPVPDLLDDLRQAVRAGDGNDVVQTFKTVPLLALDDLGTERTTDFGQEQLFAVINTRLLHMRQTLVTTNYETPTALIERLGLPAGRGIVSRLRERGDWVVLGGPDYRLRMGPK